MVIFWDFNGTILDDRTLCLDILNEMLKTHHRPLVTESDYLDIFTFPIIDYYAKVFDLKQTPFDDLAQTFINTYQPRSLNLKLSEGFKEMFAYFKQKGYKQVVLSASQIDNLRMQLKHYHIEDDFDDILGIRDVYAKSKLEIGKRYIIEQKIGKNDAVMIGDTIHDKEVADAMGIKSILYTGGHQSKHRLEKYEHVDHLLNLREKEI